MNAKWYIQLSDKRKCMLYCLFAFVSCLLFSYIYYEIQCGVNQSHEELGSLIVTYMKMYKGADYNQGWTIIKPLYYICMYFFGLTYTTQRIVYSIMFFGISIFTFDMCLRNKKVINLGNLPIYIIFMVFLHLSGNYLSQYFGDGSFGEGYYLNYPFSLHINSTFCIIFVLWGLNQLWVTNFYLNKKRYIQYCLDILILLIGLGLCGVWDWELFVLYLVFPYILLRIRPWLTRKRVFLSCFFLGILVYIAILIGINHGYLKYPRLTEIKSPYDFREQISYFFIELLCLYNIDITISDIMLIDKVVYCFRFLVLFFIAYLILSTIKNYFKKNNDLQPSDILISWGVCIFAIAFIFTNLGYYDRVRYMACILPYGTIILCNNSERFLKKLNFNKYSNLYIICCIVVICSINKDWNKHTFDSGIARISNLIEISDLHNGIGTLDVANRISVASEGKQMVYGIQYNSDKDEWKYRFDADYSDEIIDYLVFYNNRAYISDYITENDVVRKFGNPNTVIKYDEYVLMIYRDGIDINNPKITKVQNTEEKEYFYLNLSDLGTIGDVILKDNKMIIGRDGIQCGPQMDLEPGQYVIKYEGEGLSKAEIVCHTLFPEYCVFSCDMQLVSDEKIIYTVEIIENTSQVDFVMKNNGDDNITISDMELIRIKK